MLVKPWWIWKCSSSWEHAQTLGYIFGISWIVPSICRLFYNHSSIPKLSMPFLWIPSNDRLWIAISLVWRASMILSDIISFCHHRVEWRSRKQRRQDQFEAMDQHLREGQLDHEGRVSFVSPVSSYLTSRISGRDSCLVGVSCHSPKICLQIVATASMHHV